MPNYQFREADGEQRIKMQTIRDTFEKLEAVIKLNTSPSREQSTAITRLEEAAMWAIKAVHA